MKTVPARNLANLIPALVRLLLFGGVVALVLAPVHAAPEPSEIDKLIEQLASDDAVRRQESSRRLEEIGEAALEPLRKAGRQHPDPDVRLRALVAARAIDKLLHGSLRRFEGHTDLVRWVALSPDGKQLLSGGHDGTVRLWELETGKEIRRLGENLALVRSVAFSPDGKLALAGHQNGDFRLWETATGKELHAVNFGTPVCSVAFTPDGTRALLGLDDTTLRLWDLEKWQEVRKLTGHTSYVVCVAISPDGKRGLSAGEHDNTARLWDLETGKELRKFEGHKESVHSVAFSPDGKRAVSGGGVQRAIFAPGSDNTARVWDVETGKEIRVLTGHKAGVWAVAFSPDGRRILTGSGHWTLDSPDMTMRLWDVDSGKELARFEEHTGTVFSVTFTSDGKQALSSGDRTVRLWRLPK
jgi:WD40 repeat protein